MENNLYRICGSKKEVEEAKNAFCGLILLGVEKVDRITIQNLIDTYDLKATVLYKGNTVHSFKRLTNEFKKHIKSKKLSPMSDYFYTVLSNFDIAHYNKNGFIDYYNDDFFRCMNAISGSLKTIPYWRSDMQRIINDVFPALKR